jgi:hypothetical protein
MKPNLFLFLMMCFSISVTAQKDYKNEALQLKNRVFETSVISFGSNENISEYSANLLDPDLYPSSSSLNFGSVSTNYNLYSDFNYDYLEGVENKKQRSLGSVAWGAIIGGGVGIITALIYNSELNSEPLGFLFVSYKTPILLGVAGGAVGALIGLIIGHHSKRRLLIGRSEQKWYLHQTSAQIVKRHFIFSN